LEFAHGSTSYISGLYKLYSSTSGLKCWNTILGSNNRRCGNGGGLYAGWEPGWQFNVPTFVWPPQSKPSKPAASSRSSLKDASRQFCYAFLYGNAHHLQAGRITSAANHSSDHGRILAKIRIGWRRRVSNLCNPSPLLATGMYKIYTYFPAGKNPLALQTPTALHRLAYVGPPGLRKGLFPLMRETWDCFSPITQTRICERPAIIRCRGIYWPLGPACI